MISKRIIKGISHKKNKTTSLTNVLAFVPHFTINNNQDSLMGNTRSRHDDIKVIDNCFVCHSRLDPSICKHLAVSSRSYSTLPVPINKKKIGEDSATVLYEGFEWEYFERFLLLCTEQCTILCLFFTTTTFFPPRYVCRLWTIFSQRCIPALSWTSILWKVIEQNIMVKLNWATKHGKHRQFTFSNKTLIFVCLSADFTCTHHRSRPHYSICHREEMSPPPLWPRRLGI